MLLAETPGDKHEKIDSLDDLIEHCQSIWQDITLNMNTVDRLTNIKVYSAKLDFKVALIQKMQSMSLNAAFEALHLASKHVIKCTQDIV
jgi:hypothetical protein